MFRAQDIDARPYRAPLNPDFVRRVQGKRDQRVVATLVDDRERALASARMALKEAREDTELARAEVARLQDEVSRLRGNNDLASRFEKVLKDLETKATTTVRHKHTVAQIEARACRAFRVTRLELRSKRRFRQIAMARQFVMYWSCRLTSLSLPQIGRLMGGLDHTTVLHGKRSYPQKRAKMGRCVRLCR